MTPNKTRDESDFEKAMELSFVEEDAIEYLVQRKMTTSNKNIGLLLMGYNKGARWAYNSRDSEVEELKAKIEKMKEAIANEVTCPDCVEAIGDGYTICGDCSC